MCYIYLEWNTTQSRKEQLFPSVITWMHPGRMKKDRYRSDLAYVWNLKAEQIDEPKEMEVEERSVACGKGCGMRGGRGD